MPLLALNGLIGTTRFPRLRAATYAAAATYPSIYLTGFGLERRRFSTAPFEYVIEQRTLQEPIVLAQRSEFARSSAWSRAAAGGAVAQNETAAASVWRP